MNGDRSVGGKVQPEARVVKGFSLEFVELFVFLFAYVAFAF